MSVSECWVLWGALEKRQKSHDNCDDKPSSLWCVWYTLFFHDYLEIFIEWKKLLNAFAGEITFHASNIFTTPKMWQLTKQWNNFFFVDSSSVSSEIRFSVISMYFVVVFINVINCVSSQKKCVSKEGKKWVFRVLQSS
jgi:hypothetical protein